jgi:hypothetical protein
VGIDENAAQALHAEPLDKAHPAHVSGQIIDFYGSVADAFAGFLIAAIQAKIFCPWNALVPLIKRFLVHRADASETLLMEVFRQVPADEAASAGDDDEIVLPQFGFFPIESLVFHKKLLMI